ncbi:putative sulfate exporter family transporter [uncultured Sunxiuqinia sp.]|uniref:YeiH family protein n=1 Tax=uncultured Sunxiuqinia sp. TaxID=1573825 RepID=UPI002617ADE5|nr:putative sulfate exporter family transporter [uncultured Sunxiuqinia sp.]
MKQLSTNMQLIYSIAIAACFLPFVSPALALVTGILFAFLGWRHTGLHQQTGRVLQASIVLMGFGMNLTQAIEASKSGLLLTAGSVVLTIGFGLLLGKLLRVDSKISWLIASGTAICGGSAIAAIAPVIHAKNHQISFSLVVIFLLNALALLLFPLLGHYFNLSQETFGFWSAIAIHDTSSVVGAGAAYGPQALEIATAVKLTRALWIIPLSVAIALFSKNENRGKISIPWFIGLFVIAVVLAYLLPQWEPTFSHLNWLGKRGMVVALFLIGSNISLGEVKKAGSRSFILGILLWIFIASLSLLVLHKFSAI